MRFRSLVVSTPVDTPYHENPRSELVDLLRSKGVRGAVLDVGCGAGAFGRALLDEGIADSVYGVEIDEAAASMARGQLSEVLVGDISDPLVCDQLPQVDVLVAGDVLEHLIDPAGALARLATHLLPGGLWMISVPNVRHHMVLRDLLLKGEFRYRESGICDATHLRFFTRQSLERMCREVGLEPEAGYFLVAGRSGRAARIFPALGAFVGVQMVTIGRV